MVVCADLAYRLYSGRNHDRHRSGCTKKKVTGPRYPSVLRFEPLRIQSPPKRQRRDTVSTLTVTGNSTFFVANSSSPPPGVSSSGSLTSPVSDDRRAVDVPSELSPRYVRSSSLGPTSLHSTAPLHQPSKTLKPLGSLLDRLQEIARSATLKSALRSEEVSHLESHALPSVTPSTLRTFARPPRAEGASAVLGPSATLSRTDGSKLARRPIVQRTGNGPAWPQVRDPRNVRPLIHSKPYILCKGRERNLTAALSRRYSWYSRSTSVGIGEYR